MADVTLSAVAQAAGVSISTVSRVLNKASGSVPIAQGTAARVREIADELGYVPHAAARMLRTGRSRCLSVLGANPGFFAHRGSFTSDIMQGLMLAGVDCGYHLTLLTGWEHHIAGGDIHADLGTADGLLVLNRDLYQAPGHMEALRRCRLPVVYALEYPDGDDVIWTAPDDRQGGLLATQTLLERGHRQVAFIQHPYYHGIFGRRRAGWRDALAAAGSDGPLINIEELDLSALQAAGVKAAVCANDGIASRLADRLQAEQVALELIVFGHTQHPGNPPARWDMVVHPLTETISRAVKQLVACIEGSPDCAQQSVPYHLQLRSPALD